MTWTLMVPPLPQKVAFLLIWIKAYLKNLGFFVLFFEQIVRHDFLDKMLALFNKKATFVLFLAFLAVLFSQFCPNFI